MKTRYGLDSPIYPPEIRKAIARKYELLEEREEATVKCPHCGGHGEITNALRYGITQSKELKKVMKIINEFWENREILK